MLEYLSDRVSKYVPDTMWLEGPKMCEIKCQVADKMSECQGICYCWSNLFGVLSQFSTDFVNQFVLIVRGRFLLERALECCPSTDLLALRFVRRVAAGDGYSYLYCKHLIWANLFPLGQLKLYMDISTAR